MLDDKTRADWDQSKATINEILPSLWKAMYDSMLREGFDDRQAMLLLGDYIFATQSTSQ